MKHMDNDFSWILYEGSPFLPAVSQQSIKNIVSLINNRHIAAGYAISLEVAMVGTAVHELHEKDFDSLAYQYQIDVVNLTHYLFGFTTPVILLLGGYISSVRTLEQTIKIVCQATTDELLIELNSYKAFHLIKAIEIYQTAQNRHPEFIALQIYDLVRKNPFVMDQYFLIGLEASQQLFQGLLRSPTIYRPSS